MFRVINKQILASNIKRLDIYAPIIAKKVRPGQFVSVSPEEGDERVPLTVVDKDLIKNTISLIFQEAGYTTKKLGDISIGDNVFSILGPLGVPTKVRKRGHVVCIATGVGIAQILPIARAMRNAGNKVTGIIGARNKRKLVLEPQMRIGCNRILIATEDGSYERKGLATDLLKSLMDQQDINLVYAIGAPEMMERVCALTKPKRIMTKVHLNPMMVDCMGMCGSCRVKVGNEMKLACIEGPEFDGHKVDFKDFNIRMNAFSKEGGWDGQKSQHSHKKNESKTFKRFLSDILKG